MLPRSAASTARSLARRNPSTSAAARLCTRSFASASDSATTSNSSKLLDESIMDHIVCPISKLPLRYDAARGLILCPEIRVAYPIVDGVPVLVPSEGRLLRDDEEV
jgi:uncharacterized protein